MTFLGGIGTGSLRAINSAITQAPKLIFLGKHNHMIIENLGGNPIFLSASVNTTPEQWIEVAASKTLDDYTDTKIFLSCGTGLTSSIRITLW